MPSSPGSLSLLLNIISFHAPESIGVGWLVVIIGIAVGCLLISAFVSGSEIAFFGLSREEMDDFRHSDDASSKLVMKLLRNSERLLATILISNNMVNITVVVLLTFAINETVDFSSDAIKFLLETVVLTFLLLLFGEIFPKLVARSRTSRWVRLSASGVWFLYRLLAWPAKVMVRSSSLVYKMVGRKQVNLSAEELSHALEISDVKSEKDKEMLEGILTFGEKQASDIMISRVDVTAIEYHDSLSEVIGTLRNTGYSRIPVYDTSQDSIRGILYGKDLLPYIGKRDDTFRWQTLLRKAYFVPESRPIDDLLEDFRKRKIHIAIVVDEYGGTSGIVTMEDIIEEIVGDIDDEYDDDEKLFKRINDNTFTFEGRTPLTDFCRITGVDEEEFGDIGEAETVAGLLLAVKGDFPTEKEPIVVGRCRFLVLDIERHRITSVRVNISPADDETTKTSD